LSSGYGEPLLVDVIDVEIAESGKVYPNPTNSELYLELETKVAGNLKAVITNLNGQIQASYNLGRAVSGNNSNTLDVQNLAKGMYILNISLDGKPAFNQKIVKL